MIEDKINRMKQVPCRLIWLRLVGSMRYERIRVNGWFNAGYRALVFMVRTLNKTKPAPVTQLGRMQGLGHVGSFGWAP